MGDKLVHMFNQFLEMIQEEIILYLSSNSLETVVSVVLDHLKFSSHKMLTLMLLWNQFMFVGQFLKHLPQLLQEPQHHQDQDQEHHLHPTHVFVDVQSLFVKFLDLMTEIIISINSLETL